MDHLDSTLRPTDWNLTRLLRAAVDNPVYIMKVGMINSFNSRIQLLDPSSYVLRTWMDHTTAAAGTHKILRGNLSKYNRRALKMVLVPITWSGISLTAGSGSQGCF